jgi:hypothetical protein
MAFPMEGNLRRVVVGDDDDDDGRTLSEALVYVANGSLFRLPDGEWLGMHGQFFFSFCLFTGNAGCRGW